MQVAYYVLPAIAHPSEWLSNAVAFIGTMRTYVKTVLLVPIARMSAACDLFPELTVPSWPSTQSASFANLLGILRLAVICRTVRNLCIPAVDQVHSLEAYPTGMVGGWLAVCLGRPHALIAHGTYGVVWQNYALDCRLYRRVLDEAALVYPVSQGTAQLIRQYFGIELQNDRLRLILNGDDFNLQVPRQAAEAHNFSFPPTFLTDGEVKPRKGLHLSLAAFARVKAALPEVVRDCETGLLAPTEDGESIEVASLRLLRDPELSCQMGLANRRWAETLRWVRNAQEHYDRYCALVGAV